MNFVEARKKETWFFNTLFAGDEDTRQLCGIGNFRSKLVELYEQFVTTEIKKAAPKVFTKVIEYGKHMSTEWAWRADQECYENQEMMMEQLKEMIHEMVNIGKQTSEPTSVVEILLRKDVQECIDRCRLQLDPASALETSKMELMKLLATVSAKLIEQVHAASHLSQFRRFVTMGEHMVKVLVFLVRQFLDLAEAKFDEVIEKEQKRYQDVDSERIPVQEMVNSLVACAKSELHRLAKMVEDLPALPAWCFASADVAMLDSAPFLEHARPLTVEIEPPFAFTCDESGMVKTVADAEWCAIPGGSTVIQIDGTKFSLSAMLELTSESRPVQFTYSVPGCTVITDDLEVTKWMYHHEHVSHEYLEQRERFLCHRRAAEIIVLVFNAETADHNARAGFESMQGGRQLIRLDPGGDPDFYSGYAGERPARRRDFPFQFALRGACCTEGCAQTHDTAFNPCGHTVCCWECAQTLDTCPVCCIDLTSDKGTIRSSKALCYDYPTTEVDHENRVRDAKTSDKKAYQVAKDGYQQLFVAFVVPKHDATAAWAALERHRKDLQKKPKRLEGQLKLWPTFADLAEAKDKFHAELGAKTELYQKTLEAQKKQAATDLAREKQRAAGELEQEKKRAAENLVRETQRAAAALQKGKAEAQRQMEEYAIQLEIYIHSRDGRVNKSSWIPDAVETLCQAPSCTTATGEWKRHHCRGCGGLFCSSCCPGMGKGFDFQTASGPKNERVCPACRTALQSSAGVRSCKVPAFRPDGSDPYDPNAATAGGGGAAAAPAGPAPALAPAPAVVDVLDDA